LQPRFLWHCWRRPPFRRRRAQSGDDPRPRTDAWWQQRHESMNARVKKGNVDLIFIGDSITHGWDNVPDLWKKYYGKRNAVNLGISADQTCHVFGAWTTATSTVFAEIGRGDDRHEQRRPSPRAAGRTGGRGRQGGRRELRTKLPQTKVLLLAIFPAAPTTTTASARSTRRRMRSSRSWPTARRCSSSTSPEVPCRRRDAEHGHMPDRLHPNAKGYVIWADAIERQSRS